MTRKINYCNGYFMQTAILSGEPLSRMPYASAVVRKERDGRIVLQSYQTDVIEITPDGWMTCSGTYSATTRKHISAFLKEYAPGLCYCDAKRIAETGEAVRAW